MNRYTLYEFVKRIIGSIEAVGSHHIDKERHKNLVQQCSLVDDLIQEIIEEAENIKSYECSKRENGKYAFDYLCDLKEDLENVMERLKGYE